MINSNLRDINCKGSTVSDIDKRLKKVEEQLANLDKTFSSENISANNLTANSSSLGNANSESLNSTSISAEMANFTNLDVSGPINFRDMDVTENLDVKNGRFDELYSTDINSADIRSQAATIDKLTVGQIASQDGNMLVHDVTVGGTANVNKLVLGDPNIVSLKTKVSETETLNANKAQITELTAVDNEQVRDILLSGEIIRGDSVNTTLMKMIGSTAMQLGDNENQVILGCGSRPLWNDKPLATLSDLSDKITPAYKGRISTEQELPLTGTLGDYYIITTLTKDNTSGIGYALYNGEQFDTEFFYELEGYRLAALQDVIDDGQNVAIENEIARAKGKERDLYNNGTLKLECTKIGTLALDIDNLRGEEYFGKVYSGDSSMWKSGKLPPDAGSKTFCLEVLPNKENTVQRYTLCDDNGPKIWIRCYKENSWTNWVSLVTNVETVNNSEKVEGKTLSELKQIAFDSAHPLNDIFNSVNEDDDPNVIYNVGGIASTWNYIGQSSEMHSWKRTK